MNQKSMCLYLCVFIQLDTDQQTLTSSGSQLIPPSLPLIFSFDAIIINSGEGKTKRTSQISLLDIYFLLLGFSQSFARTGYFCRTFAPFFLCFFLNPTLVYEYRSVAFQPVIIKHSSYKTWVGCTRPPGSAELQTNMATNAKQTRRCWQNSF